MPLVGRSTPRPRSEGTFDSSRSTLMGSGTPGVGLARGEGAETSRIKRLDGRAAHGCNSARTSLCNKEGHDFYTGNFELAWLYTKRKMLYRALFAINFNNSRILKINLISICLIDEHVSLTSIRIRGCSTK